MFRLFIKSRNHCVLSGALAQMATIFITFPLWQVRQDPPNLPLWQDDSWEALGTDAPEFNFGPLVLLSLIFPIISPLRGTIVHLALLSVAIAFDQFRLQPQFVCVALLMLFMSTEKLYDYGRWFLVALWFWAGLHKWLSAEWFGYIAESLVSQVRWLPSQSHLTFAFGVATIETGLGIVAVFKPRVAAVGGPLLHLAIVAFLSPLGISKNLSVVPWNLYTAGMAVVLFRDSQPLITPSFLSRPAKQWLWPTVVLLLPIGFYTGHIDRTFSFVLYSGNLPHAAVTDFDSPAPESGMTPKIVFQKIENWVSMAVPTPRNHQALIRYFEKTSRTGSKLHIQDPRPRVEDRFFMMTDTGAKEIDVNTFLMPQDDSPPGNPLDDHLAILALDKVGCRMLRRDATSAVYAVQFDPQQFDPASIKWVNKLIAVEQLQFENCPVADKDLLPLRELPLLSGLGLNQTNVTDAAIETLTELQHLQVLQVDGTAITPEGRRRLGLINPHGGN
jgi:hypothetical protein